MTNTSEPRTLSAVIGANLRRLREAERLTQDETQRLLRNQGLSLHQSAIVGIEAGTRSVALGELVVIASAFAVPVSELMAGEGPVQLTPDASADLATVGSFLQGEVDPADFDIDSPGATEMANFWRQAKAHMKHVKKIWPDGTPAGIIAAERASDSPSERKAARSLGIPPIDLSIAAFRLWGTSLTDRRNALVADRTDLDTPSRTVQAIRGRVTRELLAEIRQQIEEG